MTVPIFLGSFVDQTSFLQEAGSQHFLKSKVRRVESNIPAMNIAKMFIYFTEKGGPMLSIARQTSVSIKPTQSAIATYFQ